MGVLGGASAPAVPDGTLKARGGTSMERIKIFGEAEERTINGVSAITEKAEG
jgi:hypothetical protein